MVGKHFSQKVWSNISLLFYFFCGYFLFYFFDLFKELRNYNCILFLYPPRKRQKYNQHFKLFFLPSMLTLWHIRLSSYRKTSLIFTKSINLILSSLEIYGRVIHTKYTTRFFTLSEKKPLPNIQKQQLQKTFSPVSMLLLLLASINVFIPCDNWKTLFFIRVY